MPTLQETDVRQFLITTIVDEMNMPIDTETLTDDSPVGVGGIDLESLRLIELTVRLQRQYGIEIEDADIESLISMTLGELVDYVVQRKAAAS